MGKGLKAKVAGQGLADIGKSRSLADFLRSEARAERQDGHAFTGVIGAAPGRVTTVIAGDDDQIVAVQSSLQLWQAAVETLKSRSVALNIAAMTIVGVEIDEVGEKQAAVEQFTLSLKHRIEQCVVAGGLDNSTGSAMSEDIADLT
jgi:hypothetical protein